MEVVEMTDFNNSITKEECEEFALLEKKLSSEQKRAIINVMEGILLRELVNENIEKSKLIHLKLKIAALLGNSTPTEERASNPLL